MLTLERTKLDKINEEVRNCTKCHLAKKRQNAVPGQGNPSARIALVAQAPGEVEDDQRQYVQQINGRRDA